VETVRVALAIAEYGEDDPFQLPAGATVVEVAEGDA
jgi:hypothetical protein